MIATRKASHEVIQWAAAEVPHLVSGSADLEPSTLTLIKDGGSVQRDDYSGRNVHYGVREHGMGAIVNGLCLHGLKAFGSTFFNFSDYMKGAMRLASIMHLPAIFVFTHDSIGLGEDGPTHQPVEQLAHLRATPNHYVVRPAGANETALGWRFAIEQTETPGVARLQPPGPAGLEPGRCAGRRDPPRRLRAARVLQGPRARPDPDRQRLGGAPLHRRGRPARGGRSRHARGVDAVHGSLPGAGRRVPRQRAAALRARACVGRGGGNAGLGPLDHRGRRPDRHAQLRGLRPAARAVRALRLHPREHRRDGQASRSRRRERGRDPASDGERAAGGADRRRHQRLAGPDPARPDRVGRAPGGSWRRTRCAA